MNRAEKQALIKRAYDYNDPARRAASCNALYMGSMATAMLYAALGGKYGRGSLTDLIMNATDAQLDAGLRECDSIIRHGKLS